MGITQPAGTNIGRGRAREMKVVSATARELRSSATGISKKEPSKQKSLSRERVSFGIVKRSVSTGDKGKRKAEEMEEDEEMEAETEQQERIPKEQQDEEIENLEVEVDGTKGQDIRVGESGEYHKTSKGSGGKDRFEEQSNIKRKPRHSCEIEVPKDKESATFAETIEEECYRFDSFLGVRVAREPGKEKKIIATFENTIDMHDACNINFGNEQNRKFLIPTEQVLQQQDLGRQVIVRDIPLAVSEGAIKTLLRKFGEIEKILFRTVEMWQTAIVTFKEEETAKILAEQWSIPFGKESLRILPVVGEKEELKRRSEYILKLTGLPAGTTAYDLEEIGREIRGKTMYIPRTTNYFRERFAFIAFENEEQMQQAWGKEFQLDKTKLVLVHQHVRLCYKCGQEGHIAIRCGEVRVQRDREMAQARFVAIQSRFRKGPEGKAPITYAEALRKHSRSRSMGRQSNNQGQDNIERRLTRLETKIAKIERCVEKLCSKLIGEIEEEEEEEQAREVGADSQMGEEDDNNQYEDAEEKWQEHQVETNMRYEMNNKAIEDRQTRIENQMDSLMGKISELIEQGQNSMAKDTGARQ
jgi:hypothetical protein